MTTKEKNKLLAEFLELKPINVFGRYSISKNHIHVNCETEEEAFESFCKSAKFDTDWNWLMEVVEKIENLNEYISIYLYPQGCTISKCKEFEGDKDYFDISIDGDSKIEAVYNACVEFIQWYYRQNLS